MTLPSADESLLRRYLLGTVTDAARQDLETRLFSDDRIFWERIAIAEDELVSDYVQNGLSQEERQDFEKHFLCTDERRSKVEFASALHTHARTTRPVAQEQPAHRESRWAWLRRPMLSPAWAAAAAALLLVVVQVPRFVSSSAGDAGQEITSKVALPNATGQIVPVSLSAERLRAVGGELTRVRLGRNSQAAVLVLDRVSFQFPNYRALVYHVDNDALVTEVNVTPGASPKIVLAINAELLPAGDYYLRLQGVSPGKDPEPLQRYDFRVLHE